MPVANSINYCDYEDVENILSVHGVDLRLDDDGTITPSVEEIARLNVWAINIATSKVNMYVLGLYNASDLQRSWLINFYATVIASRLICARRLNPVPESLMQLYEEAIKDLEDLKAQYAFLNDVGMRNVPWPAWSNIRFDTRYRVKQLRVERVISEKTPVQDYSQTVDRTSELLSEW